VEFVSKDAVIISASKGIEHGTLSTVSSVLEDLSDREVAALSGPSFAKEVIDKLPTAVTMTGRLRLFRDRALRKK
jgi:glycerol-3-phosphate dehydrogenase (NAD(P)+)